MTTITYGIHTTPLGDIIIGKTDKGLCWLGFMVNGFKGNGFDRMVQYFPKAVFENNPTATQPLMNKILKAWEQDTPASIPMDIRGTDFHKRVWSSLLAIKRGQTKSYKDVAVELGNPKGMRAVGGAVGTNPISLLIPCHRILKHDGSLGNYGWGVDIKQRLLEIEKKAPSLQAA